MASASNSLHIEDLGTDNVIDIRCKGLKGSITVRGNNNRVYIADIPRPGTVNIRIESDGSQLTLGRLRRFGTVRVILKDGGHLTVLGDTTIEGCYFLAQGADIHVGKDCMISFDIIMRTTDAHGIYDLHTGALKNPPQDIKIADHVWVGQRVTLQKGVIIGTNSVVGASTILGGKTIPASTIVAGVPARVLDTGIIWDRRMTPNAYADDADVDPLFARHRPDRNSGDDDAGS